MRRASYAPVALDHEAVRRVGGGASDAGLGRRLVHREALGPAVGTAGREKGEAAQRGDRLADGGQRQEARRGDHQEEPAPGRGAVDGRGSTAARASAVRVTWILAPMWTMSAPIVTHAIQ